MIPFYDKLYETDGFIAGFPIYTARENGIMANFIDRWDCLSNPALTKKMPDMKKGLIVCSWMWPNTIAYDNIVENMVILFRLHKILTTDVLVITGTRGKKHGKGVVKNHPDILDDPAPSVYFTEFGDSSLNLLIICWIREYREKFRITDEINMAIKKRFEEENIEIPFPQRDIHIR